MKRMVTMLAATVLLVAVLALPAFAAANENANCIGELASGGNQMFPGLGGRDVSEIAHIAGGLGRSASNNCFQTTN
jgi:hypothetical protein